MKRTKMLSFVFALFLMLGAVSTQAQSDFPPLQDEPNALTLVQAELPALYANVASLTEKNPNYADAVRQLNVYVLLYESLEMGGELEASIQAAFAADFGTTASSSQSTTTTFSASRTAPTSFDKTTGTAQNHTYNDALVQEIVDLLSL